MTFDMITLVKVTKWMMGTATVATGVFLASCQKEEGASSPDQLDQKVNTGDAKSNTMYMFRFENGATPYEFTVQEGGYCIGKVRQSLSDGTFPGQEYAGNGYLWTAGYSPNSTSQCRFNKGSNASTWGPWYVVVPNQGPVESSRSVLKFRMKGTGMGVGSGTHRFFTYRVNTNIWYLGTEGVAAEAAGKLEHQTLTGVPMCELLPVRD